MLNDRNHVNTLIDEMFASVLEVNSDSRSSSNRSSCSDSVIRDSNDNKVVISNKTDDTVISSSDNLTVIVISDDNGSQSSNASTADRKAVKFDDSTNHALLIDELQRMRVRKRQRMPPEADKIRTSDWFGVSERGEEVRMSSCHITIEDACRGESDDCVQVDYERINKMSHLHGLPPLPKSLSGFNFSDNRHQGQRQTPPTPARSSSIRGGQGAPPLTPTHQGLSVKKMTNLDAQLAILRREMYTLRQQDISLLSQLWSLNESIQDFRQILQDQEDRVLSPPSPSPTPSSADEEEFYMSATSVGYRAPSSVVGRKLSGSSAASGSVG